MDDVVLSPKHDQVFETVFFLTIHLDTVEHPKNKHFLKCPIKHMSL